MNRSFVVLALILSVALFSGACTRVGPGHVGIKVSLAGSNRGVNDLPLQTGWVFYMPGASQVFEYPTFVQTAKWTKSLDEGKPVNEEITFTNADGMQFGADISLAYHLVETKVPHFYVKFRSDDLDNFTHGFLRNLARDKFDKLGGKYSISQIMGDNAEFLKDVRDSLQAELTPVGVELDQFGFIGAPRPPQAIQQAINDKAQAAQLAQQKQNELQQAQADAAKAVATTEGYAKSVTIRAEAESRANKIVSESLTPQLVEKMWIDKWDGVVSTVTTGGNGGVLYNVAPKK